jgi:hypothetical protein
MSAPVRTGPGFRAGGALFARRGLEATGLDLDFTTPDRPTLVTDLLTACAEPPPGENDREEAREDGREDGREEIWCLSLAARIGGLLAVFASTTRSDVLDQAVRCPGCREELEVSLPVTRLLDLARSAEDQSEIVVDTRDGPVRLRRPRGSDQRAWRQREHDDAEAGVLASLVVAGPTTDRSALDAALAEFDPLTCFALDVTCPCCGARSDIPIDLEASLLVELARVQARTIRDVAALARRYGWSEAEVLTVPPWRRRIYLDLDDEGWP